MQGTITESAELNATAIMQMPILEHRKLDPEIKAKWLRALRSGEYEQARSVLKSPQGGFCCLGVLADVCGAKWSEMTRPINGAKYLGATLDIDGESKIITDGGLLDHSFLEKIGLENQRLLAEFNDGGQTFAQIADYIERNY